MLPAVAAHNIGTQTRTYTNPDGTEANAAGRSGRVSVAQNIGVGSCRGETYGDMLEAIARIAPLRPSEAMARIAPRRNGTVLLDQSCRVKIPEQGSLDSIRNCSRRSK
jgi:hypothetical protein